MADVPLMNNPMTTAGDVIYGGASGSPTRLAVGTAGQVLKVNAGATAPEWDDETAGGGGSHSYVGTNAIGASTEAAVAHTWYAKSVTAPADGILLSIGVYATGGDGGATPTWMTGVWADSTGPSGPPLAASHHGAVGTDTTSGAGGDSPGWLHMPVGLFVPNGTVVWMGVQPSVVNVTLRLETTGGTDRTWDHAASLALGAGFVAITTTTKDYSIRASFLSL